MSRITITVEGLPGLAAPPAPPPPPNTLEGFFDGDEGDEYEGDDAGDNNPDALALWLAIELLEHAEEIKQLREANVRRFDRLCSLVGSADAVALLADLKSVDDE